MKTLRFVLIALLLLLATDQAPAGERCTGILAEGTPFESTWFVYDSGQPGPTVVITGGMHGNEPAGARAARQIADWSVRCGKLVVLPRCNPPGLEANTRLIPGMEGDAGNLNRHFPRLDAETAIRSEQGERIWAFVVAAAPDILVGLHEGYGVRGQGSESVGSSVLTLREQDRDRQALLLEAVNGIIADPRWRFVPINSIVSGSLARAAAEQLGAEAHIFETTWKGQPLSKRVRQHRTMVAALLNDLEMADGSTDLLVNALEGRPTVALYDGPGAGDGDQGRLFESILSDCRVERLGPADVRAGALAQFEAVIFPGGSGSKQGKALGEVGRAEVQRFVAEGGTYIGVCAGAYLALHNYDWGLKLVPYDSYDRVHWRRGFADLTIETTAAGAGRLGLEDPGPVKIAFRQGPLLVPAADVDLGEPTVLAWYRTGVGKNETDPLTMLDTPAIVAGQFGKGQVVLFSPHPEKTPGLESWIRRAILSN